MFWRRKHKSDVINQDEAFAEVSLLFVYGTLMRGGANERFLASPDRAQFVEEARVRGKLYDIGEFPALVPAEDDEPESWVYGEIYALETPDILLKTLDVIEGVNEAYPERSLFKRICLTAYSDSGEKTVWAYVYNQPLHHFPRIPSGNYREYLKSRQTA
ncbi:MAG: gamma-glutamylcyclotransferase family protein [candidate division KSB1 bacterium]|nr:gamma-glutamylcyclotransferase family protein [candidate division KSB1 bacterium]MDQ7062956.1 gamma-glutamylcyclotransferase family protein [candidate division KSB1 bacterium]